MGPAGCIMGPFIVIFGLLVGGFLFIVLKMIAKTKASSWKGVIVDKLYNERRGSFEDSHKMEHFYTLVVKTDEGQTRKIAVAKPMYDSCTVGDKLEKPKGALNPTKV
jgi:hypothetical protein